MLSSIALHSHKTLKYSTTVKVKNSMYLVRCTSAFYFNFVLVYIKVLILQLHKTMQFYELKTLLNCNKVIKLYLITFVII